MFVSNGFLIRLNRSPMCFRLGKYVGLRFGISVSDGSLMKHVEVSDGTLIRHVGLQEVFDQAYQSPMKHVEVSDEAC